MCVCVCIFKLWFCRPISKTFDTYIKCHNNSTFLFIRTETKICIELIASFKWKWIQRFWLLTFTKQPLNFIIGEVTNRFVTWLEWDLPTFICIGTWCFRKTNDEINIEINTWTRKAHALQQVNINIWWISRVVRLSEQIEMQLSMLCFSWNLCMLNDLRHLGKVT